MKIEFTGHSDDIVRVYVDGVADEFGAYDAPKVFHLVAPDDSTMAVVAMYGLADSTWVFGPGIYEEAAELPDWPVSVAWEHAYSVRLSIEVPEGTVVELAGY